MSEEQVLKDALANFQRHVKASYGQYVASGIISPEKIISGIQTEFEKGLDSGDTPLTSLQAIVEERANDGAGLRPILRPMMVELWTTVQQAFPGKVADLNLTAAKNSFEKRFGGSPGMAQKLFGF